MIKKIVTVQRELKVEDEAPEAMPIFWISKWVDYSDKYGIGYQLCDNSVGVLFNDSSKLVLDEAGSELTYIEKNEAENYYGIESYPDFLSKKLSNSVKDHTKTIVCPLMGAVTYIDEQRNFRVYKLSHLESHGCTKALITRLRYVKTMVERLMSSSNTRPGSLSTDHTMTVVCSSVRTITFIDEKGNLHVYKLSHLEAHGCTKVRNFH
uniref:Polo kinase n=1 Tax=Angiostrongylus cantonensis TaxID=6313 RepID=A0A0K0DLW5_ANGCA